MDDHRAQEVVVLRLGPPAGPRAVRATVRADPEPEPVPVRREEVPDAARRLFHPRDDNDAPPTQRRGDTRMDHRTVAARASMRMAGEAGKTIPYGEGVGGGGVRTTTAGHGSVHSVVAPGTTSSVPRHS